jgi:hypothetical protein
VANFCYFCEVVECMCQHGYAWRGQGCSLVDHWKWLQVWWEIAWWTCMQNVGT